MGVVTGGGGGAAFNGGTITGDLTVNPTNNTTAPLIKATAPAGFEANSSGELLQVFCEDGTAAIDIDTYGDFTFKSPTGEGTGALRVLSTDNSLRSVSLSTTSGVFVASSGGAIQLVADNGTTRLFYTDATMGILTSVHAAPADGSLNAGECALWFDQTNGASKLMVKGKSANGTVVTAAIALS